MSIFPIIDPQSAEAAQVQELPLCREIAWDFEKDVPVFQGGEPVIVEGKEAVRVWIWKALHTPRYKYEIYSGDYGSDLENLVGHGHSDAVKTAEAPRYLTECLLVNPYIKSVKDIAVAFADTTLTVAGTAVTVYGEVKFNAAA